MRIEIRDRYKPFTDQRGAEVLLPNSSYGLTVYPCKVFIHDLTRDAKTVAEIDIALPGPSDEFVTQLDLERGEIAVFGKCAKTFFRYFISFADGKILFIKNKPESLFEFHIVEDTQNLISTNQEIDSRVPIIPERLSFGSFKKQHIDTVLKRGDLRDILPLWHALAKVTPAHKAAKTPTTLLSNLAEAVSARNKELVTKEFKSLIRAGFRSLLYPQKKDSLHQGYSNDVVQADSSLALIHEGACIIRSLILETAGTTVAPLPFLPPPLASGRMTGASIGSNAYCSLEWRSGKLTRMLLTAQEPLQIHLALPKDIESFRARNLKNGITWKQPRDQKLDLSEDSALYLDRFQH
ncbi:hypothetical protein [Estrella lausannensis]|uniref:Uncharacterized protein n=1 Tax=Estrella lausannensis TaxID=483423 RepID=A0A0H5E4P3_9BACT|nr:hypothetical protein [Estrella lausannensis]CRX38205.1 Conserved hypothetical protein [Estrella lausannensis]